jgi:hypothetical protein
MHPDPRCDMRAVRVRVPRRMCSLNLTTRLTRHGSPRARRRRGQRRERAALGGPVEKKGRSERRGHTV